MHIGPPVLTSFVTLLSENLRSTCVSAALGPALTVALSVTPSLLVRTAGLTLLTPAGPGPATGPSPVTSPGPAIGPGPVLSPGPATGPAVLFLAAGHPGDVHPAHFFTTGALGQFHE